MSRLDLGPLKQYRTYYAISDVSPPAHLYTVWYRNIEPTVLKVRAFKDATGRIHVEQVGGWWGGLGIPPRRRPPSPPAELARITKAVQDAVAPCGHGLMIAYNGHHHVLRVHEIIKHGHNVGWFATAALRANGALTRIEGMGEQQSGFGLLHIPAGARWVAYTPPPGSNGNKLALGNPSQGLNSALLAAARAWDAGVAGPTLASLQSSNDTALLPPGFSQKLRVDVTIYGRARDFKQQRGGHYYVALPLSDAVFGGSATGKNVVKVGRHAFVIAAKLASPPRSPSPKRAHSHFAGTLTVTLDGGARQRFSRSYPATGPIELEGHTVVAPTGFVLPGARAPSPEAARLHARLPGDNQFESFDVYVGVSIFADPREQ